MTRMQKLSVFLCFVGFSLIIAGLLIKSETYQMRYDRCIEVVKMYKNYVER